MNETNEQPKKSLSAGFQKGRGFVRSFLHNPSLIPALFLLAAVCLAAVLLWLLWTFVPRAPVRWGILSSCTGLCALAGLWVYRQRRQTDRFADELCETLDALLSDQRPRLSHPYDDSLASRVQGKLMQYEETQAFLDSYTETVNPGLPVVSRQSMASQYEAETRSSAVTGSAISIVIALVGILNFVNSMVTAIVSRRREFAVIQSIGMTKKQLRRMLVNEGLCYAIITLAASYLLGSLAVGIGVRAMVAGGFTTFRFTLLPLLICTPILLLFAVLIPCICFRNLEKHSIVERLRTE